MNFAACQRLASPAHAPLNEPHRFQRVAPGGEAAEWIQRYAKRIKPTVQEDFGMRALAGRYFDGARAIQTIDRFVARAELVGYIGPIEAITFVLGEHQFEIEFLCMVPDRDAPTTTVTTARSSPVCHYDTVVSDADDAMAAARLAEIVLHQLERVHCHELGEVFRVGGKRTHDPHAGEAP